MSEIECACIEKKNRKFVYMSMAEIMITHKMSITHIKNVNLVLLNLDNTFGLRTILRYSIHMYLIKIEEYF